MDEAQRLERLAASIDQVADQPEPVRGRVVVDLVEQAAELVVATLQVADGVGRHQGAAPVSRLRLTTAFTRQRPVAGCWLSVVGCWRNAAACARSANREPTTDHPWRAVERATG